MRVTFALLIASATSALAQSELWRSPDNFKPDMCKKDYCNEGNLRNMIKLANRQSPDAMTSECKPKYHCEQAPIQVACPLSIWNRDEPISYMKNNPDLVLCCWQLGTVPDWMFVYTANEASHRRRRNSLEVPLSFSGGTRRTLKDEEATPLPSEITFAKRADFKETMAVAKAGTLRWGKDVDFKFVPWQIRKEGRMKEVDTPQAKEDLEKRRQLDSDSDSNSNSDSADGSHEFAHGCDDGSAIGGSDNGNGNGKSSSSSSSSSNANDDSDHSYDCEDYWGVRSDLLTTFDNAPLQMAACNNPTMSQEGFMDQDVAITPHFMNCRTAAVHINLQEQGDTFQEIGEHVYEGDDPHAVLAARPALAKGFYLCFQGLLARADISWVVATLEKNGVLDCCIDHFKDEYDLSYLDLLNAMMSATQITAAFSEDDGSWDREDCDCSDTSGTGHCGRSEWCELECDYINCDCPACPYWWDIENYCNPCDDDSSTDSCPDKDACPEP